METLDQNSFVSSVNVPELMVTHEFWLRPITPRIIVGYLHRPALYYQRSLDRIGPHAIWMERIKLHFLQKRPEVAS